PESLDINSVSAQNQARLADCASEFLQLRGGRGDHAGRAPKHPVRHRCVIEPLHNAAAAARTIHSQWLNEHWTINLAGDRNGHRTQRIVKGVTVDDVSVLNGTTNQAAIHRPLPQSPALPRQVLNFHTLIPGLIAPLALL